MHWRIERDYQELKQELGLGDYEGRGWRGFHHHASLCIAACGFLVATRLEEMAREKPYNCRRPPYLGTTGRGLRRGLSGTCQTPWRAYG